MSTNSAHSSTVSLLAAMTGVAWLAGIGLLVSGSVRTDVALLAWGVAGTSAASGMACLLTIHVMIVQATVAHEEVLVTTVERTAIRVGDAISAGLSEDQSSDRGGAVILYS